FDPYVTLDSIENVNFKALLQQANAISIHVPLTKNGEHATYHLFNEETFAALQPDTILINSARGPVVKEAALIEDIQRTKRK
ncbi:NAD(P)-dependent oxidoreductase, partial [Acinetobacter baumannii]